MKIRTRKRGGGRGLWWASTALGSALAILAVSAAPAGASGYHAVRRGESLSTIARAYDTSVARLAQLNGIADPEQVQAGRVLRISARSSSLSASSRPASSRPAAAFHTVAPGESLGRIAARYGTTVAGLARLNGLTDVNHIRVGTRLKLRDDGAGQPAPPQDAPRPTGSSQTPRSPQQAPIIGQGGRPVVPLQPPADEVLPQTAPTRLPDNTAVLTTSLPVVLEGRRFTAVPTQTTVQTVVAVSANGLADSLGEAINPETAARLRALGEGLVPIAAFADTGVGIQLDTATLALAVTLTPTARSTQTVSLGTTDVYEGAERVYPGRFATGLTGALVVTDDIDDDADPVGEFAFSGFVNVGGLKGINLDYGGSYLFSSEDSDFQRDAIVLFKDDPERALRYSAGDLTPFLPRLAGFAGVAGISIERNYEELQPTRNVRPTGRRSFVLERRSTVEVYSNGALINRFTAEPGAIDLGDIPLANLSNNVTIVVEDALGRRELDSFSLSNDLTLLSAGLSEFSFSAGVLRDDFGSGFEYTSDPVATGYYTRGLTDNLTVGGNLAVSKEVSSVGGSVAWSLFGGVALTEAEVSQSDFAGTGYAASFNFRGGPFLGEERNDTLSLTADYTSEDFSSLGDRSSFIDSEWFLGADYRFNVTETTAVSFGGTVQTSHNPLDDDAYTGFVGLTQRIGRVVVSLVGRTSRLADGREDTGGFISLSLPFGQRETATASYDSISETARAEIVRSRGIDVPNYDYRLGTVRRQDETEVNASIGYTATRYEAGLAINSRLDLPDGASGGQVVTGRLQSGFGYVDGAFGIGRDPGRGFYLVDGHPSLGNARISVETNAGATPIARSGPLGPAVAPTGQPYRTEELRVNVSGGPVGYDIGSGRYVVEPGARTGVRVTVGTDEFRTVVTAITVEGERLGLAYGTLTNLDDGTTKTFFTNRVGRAVFSNLGAGRYRATFREPAGSFEFTISEETEAYVDIGVNELELEP
jgi:outer membrane usher protein FimD/PapC/LysM repeat protein